MAIDTDEKKYSSMMMWMPFRMSAPIPSQVAFTSAQMQQMLFQYSGIPWVIVTATAAGVIIKNTAVESVILIKTAIEKVINLTFSVK